jgi:hypothetical protein
VLWSHYFIKLLIYKPLESGFQTPLRKLGKGDVYVSNSSWKYLQSFLPLFETLSNFTMAWSLLSTCSVLDLVMLDWLLMFGFVWWVDLVWSYLTLT